MTYIFLSYSHIDTSIADEIAMMLDELNIEYFRDIKDIQWGDVIVPNVAQALKRCTAILVIVSPASVKSSWVPYEIGRASALQKTILPYLTHRSIDLPSYVNDKRFLASINEVREYFSCIESVDIGSAISMTKNRGMSTRTIKLIMRYVKGDGNEQLSAAKELLELQIPCAIHIILSDLESKIDDVKRLVMRRLRGTTANELHSHFVRLMRSDDPILAPLSAGLLLTLGDDAALPVLLAYAASDDTVIKSSAISALSGKSDYNDEQLNAVTTALIDAMHDGRHEVRMAALNTTTKLNSQFYRRHKIAIGHRVRRLLTARNEQVRELAAIVDEYLRSDDT